MIGAPGERVGEDDQVGVEPVAIVGEQAGQMRRTRLLLALWATIPLLFFSLSTRQEYYVLPAIPALLLLIAAWLNDEALEAESFAVPNPLVQAGQRISIKSRLQASSVE